MSTPFRRTLAFLDAEDRSRPGRVVLVLGLLLVGWTLWLTLSKTTVYAVSDEGRLLASGAASPVQTPVVGVIAESRLVLGADVKAGDVLVELDSSAEKLRRDEERARLDGLQQAIASLERVLSAERGLARATEQAGASRVTSAATRARVAADIATLTKQQDEAIRRLKEASLVSGLEALKAAEDAERQRGQAVIDSAETAFATADYARVRKEAEVRILGLERELAELESRSIASRATIAQLDWEVARRSLRAPVDGTVADVLALPKGAAVAANQVIATIVPPTTMRWVSYFPAREAVGRIRPGQTARIRLDAFPWTAYGPVSARVSAVGSEPRDGRVRVELELLGANPGVPLAHGMAGITDVEVDEISPLRLLLRLSGQMMQRRADLRSISPAPSASTEPGAAP